MEELGKIVAIFPKNNELDDKPFSKCGEIFVTKIGKFRFDCLLCGLECDSYKFLTHVLQEHLTIEPKDLLTDINIPVESNDSDIDDSHQSGLHFETNDDNGTSSPTANISNDQHKLATKEKKVNKRKLERGLINPKRRSTRKKIKEDLPIDNPKCQSSEVSVEVIVDQEIIEQLSDVKNTKGTDDDKVLELDKEEISNESKEKFRNEDCGESNEAASGENVEYKFSCDICKLKVKKSRELLNHKRKTCGFRCEICPEILSDEKLLRSHVRSHFRKRKKDKIDEKLSQVFVCEICGRDFNDASNLRAHIKKHDPDRKIFPCDNCDKTFLKEISLENHVKLRHLKEKPFICKVDLCGRSFVNAKALENHQVFHGERKYECSICNKKYLYKSKLKEHVKLYHVQGRIHHCPECEKSFYDPWTLKSHMVCHTGEKPFACDECDARFPREKALIWHKKVHSGIKDYVCKLCNQAFYIYNGLYAHMKSHGIKYSKNMEKELLMVGSSSQNQPID